MFVHSLKIGNVEIKNNIFLAPMAGVTDKAFRKIVQEKGAGLTYTEMVSSKALYFNDKKTEALMNTEGEVRPIAIQIFGHEPEVMASISKKVAMQCDIIDINMGCPMPKVVKNGDGSKLLLTPNLVYEIVNKVVESVEIPVTVKMRIGWDENHNYSQEIAKKIEEAGASAITIHGRTKEQYYSGVVDLDAIKKVKEAVSIPVIGNGDIKSREDAKRMIEYTGVDGIMIGRGTLGNPWIFKKIICDNDEEPTKEEKLETMLLQLAYEIEDRGEKNAILEMRKHFGWYTKGLPDATSLREQINKLTQKDEIEQLIKKSLA